MMLDIDTGDADIFTPPPVAVCIGDNVYHVPSFEPAADTRLNRPRHVALHTINCRLIICTLRAVQ
jgi:hypothetical protein